MKVAKERKSSILASNAVHHRVDSLTSIVALVAIGGSHILEGASWLDPVGGLLVSLMVIRAGFGNTLTAVYELVDVGVEDDMKDAVRRATQKVLQEESESDFEVYGVQGTKAGQNYLMDIEIGAPADWTLDKLRKTEEVVRSRVGSRVKGVRKLRIKFVTKEQQRVDFSDDFIPLDVNLQTKLEPDSEEEPNLHGDKKAADLRQRR